MHSQWDIIVFCICSFMRFPHFVREKVEQCKCATSTTTTAETSTPTLIVYNVIVFRLCVVYLEDARMCAESLALMCVSYMLIAAEYLTWRAYTCTIWLIRCER